MKRTGSAKWSGDLKTGKGLVSTESGALGDVAYSFAKRFGEEKGTNPEELIGAAHASCFSMALSAELGKAGITAESIATSSTVEVKPGEAGFTITSAHLTVQVTAPGADKAAVEKATNDAKAGCPVSKVLKAEVTMEATYNV